jgi:type II secretory pathway pseudopilin PulG
MKEFAVNVLGKQSDLTCHGNRWSCSGATTRPAEGGESCGRAAPLRTCALRFPLPLREGVRGWVGRNMRGNRDQSSCAPPSPNPSLKGSGAGCRRDRARGNSRGHGFTLLETALAIVIVGVGVLAIVAAQQAFHQKNSWSTHVSIASALGNEIRELTLNLPRHDPVTGQATWGPETTETWVGDFDDLDDFDGWIFSAALDNGPINARREIIPNMAGWSQTVHVTRVGLLNIHADPAAGDPYLMMIEVVIDFQGPQDVAPSEITTVRWIAPN